MEALANRHRSLAIYACRWLALQRAEPPGESVSTLLLGQSPAEEPNGRAGGLPGDVLQDAVSERPHPEPGHVVKLPLGIFPGHFTAACCLIHERQHLRAQKRRSEELWSPRIHGLVAGQAHGDVRADHVPGHRRSDPLRCCASERLPTVRGGRAHSSTDPGDADAPGRLGVSSPWPLHH